jgi:hypothetical protein
MRRWLWIFIFLGTRAENNASCNGFDHPAACICVQMSSQNAGGRRAMILTILNVIATWPA